MESLGAWTRPRNRPADGAISLTAGIEKSRFPMVECGFRTWFQSTLVGSLPAGAPVRAFPFAAGSGAR